MIGRVGAGGADIASAEPYTRPNPLQGAHPMRSLRQTLLRTAVCAIAVASLAVTGCNTVEGVGKDVEGAGKAIQGD